MRSVHCNGTVARFHENQHFAIFCPSVLLSKKRDNGHIFPTTTHTAIVAGSTPSPQSLRDSSPQAGEQFKVTPCGVVFLRPKRAKKGYKG